MFARTMSRRVAVFAMMILSSAAVAACGDDPVEESDPADSIVTMTLVVGGKTITVSSVAGGAVTNGPIVISAGTTTVTFTFQDAAGATVGGLGEFEVQCTPANAALVTYAKNAFSGSLTKVAAGSTTLKCGLWHIAEGHFDFGQYDIPITIQ